MSCDRFDKYRSGKGTAEGFARHAADCAECREQAALDARLDREIEALRSPVAADGLWDKIETSLVREKKLMAEAAAKRASGRSRLGAFFARRWPLLVPAGAAMALALLVVLGFIGPGRPGASSGILAREALAEVERTEKEYLGAIESLERQARPKLGDLDLAEMSLYRDKLAVIDDQIVRCREALASNPANAHIRRYLLAALQDKRQTLTDALASMN